MIAAIILCTVFVLFFAYVMYRCAIDDGEDDENGLGKPILDLSGGHVQDL
jgi:hypothetical protein